MQNGLPLGGIQVGEVLLGRGDGHSFDASGGVERPCPARSYVATRSANAKSLAKHVLADTARDGVVEARADMDERVELAILAARVDTRW